MQPGSLLSRHSGSAELTDTYRRGGIPTSLAPQRNIAKKCITVRALPTDQQPPRHVSDPAASGAGRSQVRVAFGLCVGDGPGPPIQIDFHDTGSLHREAAAVEKEKPPEPDGIGGFRSRCAN